MLPFSTRRAVQLATLLLLVPSLPSRADDAQALDAWKSGPPPFSFKYQGQDSAGFISGWTRTDQTLPSEGGETHRYTFTDPATSLKITADVRTYADFPAVDWVLHFTNSGPSDTPLIEDVQPLRWTMPAHGHPVLHWAQGSNASLDDFAPHDTDLGPGKEAQINSTGGRSSNNNLPFFNVQDGAQGIFGAIGWTGNWIAHFDPSADGQNLALDAGMQQTHFILHPGETVRTPRIVLLDWKGDPVDAQNLWRKFVLAHYSPRGPDGKVVTVPLAFGSWGAEPVADKLRMIQALHDLQVPIDVYWVDAGWYGTTGNWAHQRGNWTPNPAYFPPPEGLRALGSVLRDDGYGFVLWLEAETADPGSDMLTEHPDWYLKKNPNAPALLNLGDPDALKGMTDLVSGITTQGLVTWYRQDFNIEPDGYWARNDAPDRIGITEMKDIEGLYAFWDGLRRENPGLQIDNCASGGRRLDIETISRSVALWRSDLGCRPFDQMGNQDMTQGLNIWVPLNSGVIGCFGGPSSAQVKASDVAPNTPIANPALIYATRSGYSAGAVFGTHRLSIELMKPLGQEFDQVRPYFLGDFYPMTPYSKDPKAWHVLQLDRPDLKSGVIIALRRPASTNDSMAPALRGIDPNAQYDVEMRPGFDPGETQTMSGHDLAQLTLHIPDHPGSLLVFYKQK